MKFVSFAERDPGCPFRTFSNFPARTRRRWGEALLQADGEELFRVLAGRSSPRKLTPAVRNFVQVRWPALMAERPYGAIHQFCVRGQRRQGLYVAGWGEPRSPARQARVTKVVLSGESQQRESDVGRLRPRQLIFVSPGDLATPAALDVRRLRRTVTLCPPGSHTTSLDLIKETPTAGGPTKARAFYRSADVNAPTARMRLVQIAEEIIAVLASDAQANVKVSIEISAEFPLGAKDETKRAVSENATSLGFKNKTWE